MKNYNVISGVFVIGALIILTGSLFLIGNRHDAFSHHLEFYTHFANLSGMSRGAKVRIGGMDAGEVTEIDVPTSPDSPFSVKFKINDSLRGLVRTDSVASIESEGVVGDKLLSIQAGTPQAQAAPPLSAIRSKEPLEIGDLLQKGKDVLDHTDATIMSVGPKINMTLDGTNNAVGKVNDLLDGLKDGQGPAGMLLKDQALSTQIRRTMANAESITVSLNDTSAKADNMATDLQSRQLPQKVDDTITSARSAAGRLDATSLQVQQTVADISAPSVDGTTLGGNIRESLANANTATSNLSDDTEALKHNFLLRGFFKRRGYFDLAHNSPLQYRTDKTFTNPSNTRIWLGASQLFALDQKGQETLTAEGKAQIDAAFVSFGDAALSSPIVIEGYFAGTNPADQLTSSRSRSFLVRRYIGAKFQLDSQLLGAVPLKNLPPAGTGHPTWDGVCLVLVSSKKPG